MSIGAEAELIFFIFGLWFLRVDEMKSINKCVQAIIGLSILALIFGFLTSAIVSALYG